MKYTYNRVSSSRPERQKKPGKRKAPERTRGDVHLLDPAFDVFDARELSGVLPRGVSGAGLF